MFSFLKIFCNVFFFLKNYIFKLGIDIFQVFNENNQNQDLAFLELLSLGKTLMIKIYGIPESAGDAFPDTNSRFLKPQS